MFSYTFYIAFNFYFTIIISADTLYTYMDRYTCCAAENHMRFVHMLSVFKNKPIKSLKEIPVTDLKPCLQETYKLWNLVICRVLIVSVSCVNLDEAP